VLDSPARPEGGWASWRRGPRWRTWSPEGRAAAGAGPVTPDLEDAVIVASLGRRGRDREVAA